MENNALDEMRGQYAILQEQLKKQEIVKRAVAYKFNQADVKKFPAAALETFKKDICSKLRGFLS